MEPKCSRVSALTMMKINVIRKGRQSNIILGVCCILKDNPDATISIAGYADKGTGTTEINNQLSAARAKVVADKLIEAGISASRISTSAAIADDRVAVCIVK